MGPGVTELAEADLEELAASLAGEGASPAGTTAAEALRLRRILFENPARVPDVPVGWILRDGGTGRIAGRHLCIPQRFHAGGRTSTFHLSSGIGVAPEHRGYGFALFARYLALGSRAVLFATTANEAAAALLERGGGRAVPGTAGELLLPLRWSALAEEAVFRRWNSPRAARAAGPLASVVPAPASIRRGAPGLEAKEISWEEAPSLVPTPPADAVTAVRDLPWFRWRYGSGFPGAPTLFRVDGPGGAGYLALRRLVRGHRSQIALAAVLDFALPPGATVRQFADLLRRIEGRRSDAVVIRCVPAAETGPWTAAGFRERRFPNSIAWYVDRRGSLEHLRWDLRPADGDMFLA